MILCHNTFTPPWRRLPPASKGPPAPARARLLDLLFSDNRPRARCLEVSLETVDIRGSNLADSAVGYELKWQSSYDTAVCELGGSTPQTRVVSYQGRHLSSQRSAMRPGVDIDTSSSTQVVLK